MDCEACEKAEGTVVCKKNQLVLFVCEDCSEILSEIEFGLSKNIQIEKAYIREYIAVIHKINISNQKILVKKR